MIRAFEPFGWPEAAGDRDGGLWIVLRKFHSADTGDAPESKLLLANTWSELRPVTVTSGVGLSQPALTLIRDGDDERAVVAWAEGPGGHDGIHTAFMDRDGYSVRWEVAEDVRGHTVIGLRAVTSADNRPWLVWTAVGRGGAVVRACMWDGTRWTAPVSVSGRDGSTSPPAVASDPNGGFWVSWCRRTASGFCPVVRRLAPNGLWDPPAQPTNGDHLDLDPSLDVDRHGRVVVAWRRVSPRWGTMEGFRLNERSELYVAAYDGDGDQWTDLGPGGGVALALRATTRFPPIAGREKPDHWASPQSHRVFVDAEGVIRILFRRFRDVHGVYDWGFDLCETTRGREGWSDHVVVSHTAGHPDGQFSVVRMADGGAALAYQFSNYAPRYWHTADDHRFDASVDHSGVAIIRVSWGGAVPPIGAQGLAKVEAVLPGSIDVSDAGGLGVSPSHRSARPSYSPRELPASLSGDERCYFGELHRHTDISTCVPNKDGGLWDHYRWVRDVAGFDFDALTDHVEACDPASWEETLVAIESVHVAGEFVPLYGLEYTNYMPRDIGLEGQDMCLFAGDSATARELHHLLRSSPRGLDLVAALREHPFKGKLVLARHFHGGNGIGRSMDAPTNRLLGEVGADLEPVLEIVQHKGAVPEIINEILRLGERKGVIGGTDHGRPRRGLPLGVTGVWARELTRDGIMSAVFARRTFATNGPRMCADFAVSGACMGAEAITDGVLRIAGFVDGTTALRSVTVYRDGEAWRQLDGGTRGVEIDLQDSPGAGDHFYWLNAVQELGEGDEVEGELWTSSVWVTVEE